MARLRAQARSGSEVTETSGSPSAELAQLNWGHAASEDGLTLLSRKPKTKADEDYQSRASNPSRTLTQTSHTSPA